MTYIGDEDHEGKYKKDSNCLFKSGLSLHTAQSSHKRHLHTASNSPTPTATMKLSITTLLTLSLVGTSQAWDVSVYPNVDDCNVEPGGTYRTFYGDNTACHNFGASEGANCRHFTNGGDTSEPCKADELMTASSVRAYNAPQQCDFFVDTGCAGRRWSLNDRLCGDGTLRSFKCY
jgi:hypothetical protein